MVASPTANAGFWLGILSALLSSMILGILAYGRRWFRQEIIDPIQELTQDFKIEKSKWRRRHKKLTRRMERYEVAAAKERHAQVEERARVSAE